MEFSATFLEKYEALGALEGSRRGALFRARDKELGRTVIVKSYAPKFFSGDEGRRHFLAEGKILAQLHHPNVVHVYEVCDDDEAPYIVMEEVEGFTLHQEIKRMGRVPQKFALEYVRQICAGLEALHKAGLVHRNLKPENILIDAQGNVKLVDFGIAVEVGAPGREEDGMVLGTPAYMSPEQAMGKSLDARSDVYAVGIILYEMLAGEVPFRGKTAKEVMRKQVKERAPLLHEAAEGIPEWLGLVVRRCLRKRRAKRYSEVGKIVRDLALGPKIMERRPVDGAEGRGPGSSRGRAGGSRLRWAGLGLLLVLVLGGASWVFWGELSRIFLRPVAEYGLGATTVEAEFDGLRVRWTSELPCPTVLELGDGTLVRPGGKRPGRVHEVLVRGVPAESEFRYRVVLPDGQRAPWASFQVPRRKAVEGLRIVGGATTARISFRTHHPSVASVHVSTDPDFASFVSFREKEANASHEILVRGLVSEARQIARISVEIPGQDSQQAEESFFTEAPETRRMLTLAGGKAIRAALAFLDDGSPVVAAADGALTVHDGGSGELVHDLSTRADARGGVAVFEGDLLYGGRRGRFLRERPGGPVRWDVDLGAACAGAAAVEKDGVYVVTVDGQVRRLNAATGEVVWTVRLPDAVEAGPCWYAEGLHVGDRAGVMRRLDCANGKLQWAFPTADKIETAPVAISNRLLFTSRDGFLVCIRPILGRMRFKTRVGVSVGGPGCGEGTVAVGDVKGHVTCIGLARSDVLWTAELGTAVTARPNVSERGVIVGDALGRVTAFRLEDGERLWQITVGGEITGEILRRQEALWVTDTRGVVTRIGDG